MIEWRAEINQKTTEGYNPVQWSFLMQIVASDPPVRESYFSKTLMSEPVILNAAPTIVATPVGIAFSSNKREALWRANFDSGVSLWVPRRKIAPGMRSRYLAKSSDPMDGDGTWRSLSFPRSSVTASLISSTRRIQRIRWWRGLLRVYRKSWQENKESVFPKGKILITW